MSLNNLLIVFSGFLPERGLDNYSADEWQIIAAKDLSQKSIFEILELVRKKKYEEIIIGCSDLRYQRKLYFVKCILFLSRAKNKKIIDNFNREYQINFLKGFLETAKFILEIILSAFLVFKTFLIVYWLKYFSLVFKNKINEIKKIAYLRTDLWLEVKSGGSVGHIAGVINGFYQLGYNLFVVSSDKLVLVDEEKTPIDVIGPSEFYLNLPEMPELAYHYKFVRLAEKIFRDKRPDLIYQRYSLNNFSGVILSRKFKIPFILEYNGSEVWVAKNWGKRLRLEKLSLLIEEANFKWADLIVVVSKALEKELVSRGVPKNKILINPNGVDPERFHPNIDGSEIREKYHLGEKVVIGLIGTFSRWHGFEILAQAVKYIIKKCPNIHFLFIGSGPLFNQVKSIIQNDKMENYLAFTGLIPQIEAPRYLAACDILVSPQVPNPDGSEFFGSPTKLFEYMAMAKGIVASNLGQIGEILENNKTAILVKPGDVQELVEGIIKLVKDEDLRKQLGRNAREEVLKNYTWQKNIRRLIDKLKNYDIFKENN